MNECGRIGEKETVLTVFVRFYAKDEMIFKLRLKSRRVNSGFNIRFELVEVVGISDNGCDNLFFCRRVGGRNMEQYCERFVWC